MKKQIKGFTIVELVIVIAVIAILAAVMVPSFSGVIGRAKRSADTQVVRMLNSSVKIDLAERGEYKHNTMTDAIYACEEYGFSPEKIAATSDLDIAWESTTGNFVLVDMVEKEVIFPTTEGTDETYSLEGHEREYFVVTEYTPEIESGQFKYSIYAYGDNWPKKLNIHNGFDFGYVDSIEKIYYSPLISTTEPVIIRTNGSNKLYINGDDNTVIKHYGTVGHCFINHVSNNSYHEYGTAFRLELKIGHIVAESGSSIVAAYDYRDSEAKTADPNFIDIKPNAEIDSIYN